MRINLIKDTKNMLVCQMQDIFSNSKGSALALPAANQSKWQVICINQDVGAFRPTIIFLSQDMLIKIDDDHGFWNTGDSAGSWKHSNGSEGKQFNGACLQSICRALKHPILFFFKLNQGRMGGSSFSMPNPFGAYTYGTTQYPI